MLRYMTYFRGEVAQPAGRVCELSRRGPGAWRHRHPAGLHAALADHLRGRAPSVPTGRCRRHPGAGVPGGQRPRERVPRAAWLPLAALGAARARRGEPGGGVGVRAGARSTGDGSRSEAPLAGAPAALSPSGGPEPVRRRSTPLVVRPPGPTDRPAAGRVVPAARTMVDAADRVGAAVAGLRRAGIAAAADGLPRHGGGGGRGSPSTRCVSPSSRTGWSRWVLPAPASGRTSCAARGSWASSSVSIRRRTPGTSPASSASTATCRRRATWERCRLRSRSRNSTPSFANERPEGPSSSPTTSTSPDAATSRPRSRDRSDPSLHPLEQPSQGARDRVVPGVRARRRCWGRRQLM